MDTNVRERLAVLHDKLSGNITLFKEFSDMELVIDILECLLDKIEEVEDHTRSVR